MWRSEDDIVKDLASLNDFGIPGDQEPYKFLYSIGRGSKVKKNKNSETFIDSRTGEVINVKDVDVPDIFYKTYFKSKNRGRGTLLSSFSKSTLQLQQQLRLARPLGSSDEAVESYYRRNRPVEKPKPQTNPAHSEDINRNVGSGNPKADSSTVETRPRIKAVRNSTLQCNALITNLLSKAKKNSNIELISDNCSRCNSDSNVDFSIDVNSNRLNKFKKQRNLRNGFDPQNVPTISEWNEEKGISEKICNTCDQSTKKKNVAVENFEIIYDERKEDKKEKGRERIPKGNSKGEAYLIDGKGKKKKHEEKCRKLGQKHNKLNDINSKDDGEAIYDFSNFSQCIASNEAKSKNEFEVFNNSVTMAFLYNEHDFPPLRKN